MARSAIAEGDMARSGASHYVILLLKKVSIGKILDAADREAVAAIVVVARIDIAIVVKVEVVRVVRVGMARGCPIAYPIADVGKGAAIVVADAGYGPPSTTYRY